MQGLFNPLTLQGTIVVDGVAASVFTADGGLHPSRSHALLAPLRAWYHVHKRSYLALHAYIASLANWVNDVLLAALLTPVS